MLSKETKVDVKNKENKTACFIEIEGLLNSLELISDLPGLGAEEQQGQGSWERRAGERGWQVGAACALGLAGLTRGCYSLQRGGGQLVTAVREGGDLGTLAPQPLSLGGPALGLFPSATTWTTPGTNSSPRPLPGPPCHQLGLDRIQWHSADGQNLSAPSLFL